MIEQKSFSKEWMDSYRRKKEYKSINVAVLEKMIFALSLLEQLKVAGLDFIFKGGTSLVLLLKKGNRFSIDIDIITEIKREPLEAILNKVVENSHFKKYSLNERRSYKEGVPKAHYTFEFNSVYNTNVPGTVLLDILFDSPHYPEMIETPLQTIWLTTDQPTMITTPSVNAITGDKLTAFAPETTGIPYYKGDDSFAMEICKQLFDLSQLFEQVTDVAMVKKSFLSFAKAELGYRKSDEGFKDKNLSEEDVLLDTINTCAIIARRERNPEAETKKKFQDLSKGMHGFSEFLMIGRFKIEEALAASARVAYLSTLLLQKEASTIDYFKDQDISNLRIENPDWNFLNRLKRQPDKSIFYYWYQAVELSTKSRFEFKNRYPIN